MIPVYIFIKDEKKLRTINDKFTKFMYAPIALVCTCIFIAFNLVLLPFAYLAAIAKKIKLLRARKNVSQRNIQESDTTWSDLAKFICLGIPMLLISQGRDAYTFLILLFRDDVKEFKDDAENEYVLTEDQFNSLEKFVAQEMKLKKQVQEELVNDKESNNEVEPNNFVIT